MSIISEPTHKLRNQVREVKNMRPQPRGLLKTRPWALNLQLAHVNCCNFATHHEFWDVPLLVYFIHLRMGALPSQKDMKCDHRLVQICLERGIASLC